MTPDERIDRLEQLMSDLCLALSRKDTDLDGNWGYPTFRQELCRIAAAPYSEGQHIARDAPAKTEKP